ncbi:unnamed protein product [Camellia sinensis]
MRRHFGAEIVEESAGGAADDEGAAVDVNDKRRDWRGRKSRSQVLWRGFRRMSLERTGEGEVGSADAGVVGISGKRVIEPSGFREIGM